MTKIIIATAHAKIPSAKFPSALMPSKGSIIRTAKTIIKIPIIFFIFLPPFNLVINFKFLPSQKPFSKRQ